MARARGAAPRRACRIGVRPRSRHEFMHFVNRPPYAWETGSMAVDSGHAQPTILRDSHAEINLDEFLSRPLLAFLSTASEHGARGSVLWFIWEEGTLWMILEEGYNTVQDRVRLDPRVAVSITDFDPTTGLLQHVSIRGRGGLSPWDDDRASRLLRRYYRHLDGYATSPRPFGERVRGRLPMLFLRVTPESIVMRDQSYRDLVLKTGGAAAR